MITFKHWLTSIFYVFIKPIPFTFKQITKDVKGVLGASIAWVASITGFMVISIGLTGHYADGFLFTLIISITIFPIWFLLFVFLQEFLNKKIFHRKTSYYEKLLFSTAIIFVINVILDTVYFLVNYQNILIELALYIYLVVLFIISFYSITKAKIWQSIVIVILALVVSVGSLLFIGLYLMSLIQTVPSMF